MGLPRCRTLSGTAYTLSYDYDGQLTSISQGASSVTYGYDALGRRQARSTGGVTTNFNGGSKGIDIETQGASVSAQNTFGPFLVDRWASPNPNYSEYPLYDWQGSVRFATSWPGTNFSAVYDRNCPSGGNPGI